MRVLARFDEDDQRYAIAFVPLAKLVVELAFQRPISESLVREIASNFQMTRAEILHVVAWHGRLYVQDGAHRVAGARKVTPPVADLLAVVLFLDDDVDLTSPDVQAKLAGGFVALTQGRRALTALDRWRARRVARDDLVLSVDAVLDEFEMCVATNGRAPRNTVAAVGALEAIYAKGGATRLRSVLVGIDALHALTRETVTGPNLIAFAIFLQRHSEANFAQLVAKLRRRSVADFNRTRAAYLGTPVAKNIAQAGYYALVSIHDGGQGGGHLRIGPS